MERTQKYRIYFSLIFVMIAWGLNVIATKMVVTAFQPITITALRVFTAAVSVFVILLFLKKVRLPSRSELIYIIIAAFFNVVCHHYFLSLGLLNTSASNGGLILGLGPILSTIVAFLFLKTRITLLQIFGFLLGIAGVSLIVVLGSGGVKAISLGDLYVFLAILTQVLSFVMIKKISKTFDPSLMTGYMMLIGSIILFIISLFKEPDGLKQLSNGNFDIWMIFLASAIIATAMGHMIYNSAIGQVGISEAAIFMNLNPLFALIGAVVFLGEMVTLPQIFGFIFIIFGVLLGSGALEEFIHQSKQKERLLNKVNSSV